MPSDCRRHPKPGSDVVNYQWRASWEPDPVADFTAPHCLAHRGRIGDRRVLGVDRPFGKHEGVAITARYLTVTVDPTTTQSSVDPPGGESVSDPRICVATYD